DDVVGEIHRVAGHLEYQAPAELTADTGLPTVHRHRLEVHRVYRRVLGEQLSERGHSEAVAEGSVETDVGRHPHRRAELGAQVRVRYRGAGRYPVGIGSYRLVFGLVLVAGKVGPQSGIDPQSADRIPERLE